MTTFLHPAQHSLIYIWKQEALFAIVSTERDREYHCSCTHTSINYKERVCRGRGRGVACISDLLLLPMKINRKTKQRSNNVILKDSFSYNRKNT